VAREDEMIDRLEALIQEQREARDAVEKMERDLKKFAGVGKLIQSIDKEISKTFREANDLQKRGLAIGTSLAGIQRDFRNNIDTLSTGITGFRLSLGTQFDLYEAGVRSNNKGLATLAGFTKTTGGNTKALAGQLAKNLAGAQLTDQELNNLSMNTISLSQRFGISTTQLTASLDAMGEQLDNLKALNLGAEAIEASNKLSAALGPEMANLGPELLSAFSKGSSMVQSELLNLGAERRAFTQGGVGSVEAGIALVAKAGEESQKIIDQFTAGAADQTFALDMAASVFGKDIVTAAKARQQLEKKADAAGFKNVNEYIKSLREQAEINKDFTRTLGTLRERIFSPIQQAVTFLAGMLIKVLNIPIIGELVVAFGKVGVIITTLVAGTLGLVASMKALYTGTINLIKSMRGVLNGQNRDRDSRNMLRREMALLRRAFRENALRSKLKSQGLPTDFKFPKGDEFGAGVYDDIKDQSKKISEANTKRAKLAAKIGILGTALPAALSILPQGMQEAVQPFADGIGKLMQVISGLELAMSAYTAITGKQVALQAVTGKAGGFIAKIGPMLKGAFMRIGPLLLAGLKGIIPLIGSAFAAIPVIGQIALALVAIGALVFKFKDQIMAAMKWIWSKLWGAVKWLGSMFMKAIMFLPNLFMNLVKGIFSALPDFMNPFSDEKGSSTSVPRDLPKARYNKKIADGLAYEIQDSLREARRRRARGDEEGAERAANIAYTMNNVHNAMMAAKEAQEKQVTLAENAEAAREAQLAAAREDKTRPSQNVGVQPTTR
jgi:hypothetical protein